MNSIFDKFKLYFPIMAEHVSSWEPNGTNTITLYMDDNTKMEYDYWLNAVRTVLEYDGSEDTWKREFSARLVSRMAALGFDQSLLSERSGVSQVSISKYIHKQAIPSSYITGKLAKALGCSVSYLLGFMEEE